MTSFEFNAKRRPVNLIRNSSIGREALRLAPGRPNYRLGVRAGIATTAPLLLAGVLQIPELTLASLAGFSAVLCDKGGAYQTRARSLLALTLAGGAATCIGMLDAGHPVLSTAVVLLAVAAAAYLRLFGAEATSVGTLTVMTLIVASTRPASSLAEALRSSGYFMLGGAWAALLSLALWPLRVYRPARLAIGNALRELADVARSLIDGHADPAAQVERRARLGRTRSAIETARAQLARLRKGRLGPSERAGQLLALIEATDLVFGAFVAIEDVLALPQPQNLPQLSRWIASISGYASSELERVASALEMEQPLSGQALEPRPVLHSIAPAAASVEDHEPRILLRALERVERLVGLARLVDDPDAPEVVAQVESVELSTEASIGSLIRDHLSLDSAICRHALRSECATGGAVFIVQSLRLDHGYWATLTCFTIMQPHGVQTWAKALQRVAGTVVGAVLAFSIATWVVDNRLTVACVFTFVTVAVALLPLNYGAFTVFLTPAFVLLAETHAGNAELSGVRIVNTLLGACLALLGSRLLFPLSERDHIRPLLADAVAKLEALLEVVAQDPPVRDHVRAARRKVGLSLLNAEASYQRLLTETSLEPEQSEAVATLLLYAHRLASGLIALGFARGTSVHERLFERVDDLRAALAELRQAIVDQRVPGPMPEAEAVSAAGERVELLFEQLAIMQAAVVRAQV